jgi:hypothetical protein
MSKTINLHITIETGIVLAVAFGVFSGALFAVSTQSILAWTSPSQSPPNGNVSGPITTGGAQTKAGSLTLGTGASMTAPQYCIGTSCITAWPSGGGEEADTLATVTGRGASTSERLSVHGLTVNDGDGWNWLQLGNEGRGIASGDTNNWVGFRLNGDYGVVSYQNGQTQLRHDNDTKLRTHSGGIVVTGDIRADILYDQNDTDYYVNPNNWSKINNIQIVGDTSVPTPNDDNDIASKGYVDGIQLECKTARRYENGTWITGKDYAKQVNSNDNSGFGLACKSGWIMTGCAHSTSGETAGGMDDWMGDNACYAGKNDEDGNKNRISVRCCRIK